MASNADHHSDSTFVVLRCIDSDITESEDDQIRDAEDDVFVSTDDINTWDLSSILNHSTVEVKANRNRLIEHSSYFHGLLGGSFSESFLGSLSIHWNLESFFSILRSIFGCAVDVTAYNFVLLYEAALFFGVEMLLLKCQNWLKEVTSCKGLSNLQLQLDSLIVIWKFGHKHANDLIPQLCTCYLARNFMWAMSLDSFSDVPYELLYSCVQHPELTVDSEKHLCDAILVWLAVNSHHSGCFSTTGDGWNGMLKQIRAKLLPFWYVAGKRRCSFLSNFADESIDAILRLAENPFASLMDINGEGDLVPLQIRLTEYTKKLDLSGCPQIRPILLASLLPSSYIEHMVLRKNVKRCSLNLQHFSGTKSLISRGPLPTLIFEAVQEVDISNCPMLDLEDAIQCFSKSFPCLRKLRAVHFIAFDTKGFCHLIKKCLLLSEVDMTVDISPLLSSEVSVISSFLVQAPLRSTTLYNIDHCPAEMLSSVTKPQFSNITSLTLEGRADFSDSDLTNIAELCPALCYVNLKGCTSVTDDGISVVILKCVLLTSILASDTSFGEKSVWALCSGVPDLNGLAMSQVGRPLHQLAPKLQMLDIGGCWGKQGNFVESLA